MAEKAVMEGWRRLSSAARMRVFVRPTAGGAGLPLKRERRFSDLAAAPPSDLQITASLLEGEKDPTR